MAYEKIKEEKNTGESFSNVVLRLIEEKKKKNILEFAGKWNLPKDEAEKIKKELQRGRKSFKTREVHFK